MKRLLVGLLLLLSLKVASVSVYASNSVDCCTFEYSGIPGGCDGGVEYNGTTYYCIELEDTTCSDCNLYSNYSSSTCESCCTNSRSDCGYEDGIITSSTYTLVCIIFAGSCCCCAAVFLSAEQNRVKEGITFQEAYLLPIPLVAAELDFEDDDKFDESLFPPDQPTAIARAHTSIGVTVAEPTEYSTLVYP